MNLVNLTGRFAGGTILFDNLPDITEGFVRLLVTGHLETFQYVGLELVINEAPAGHWFGKTVLPAAQYQDDNVTTGNATEGQSVFLSNCRPVGTGGKAVMNSEVVIGMSAGSNFISARAQTTSMTIGDGDVYRALVWNIAGGCNDQGALTSLRINMLANGVRAANASGTARLFPFEHIPNLQAVI